MKDTDFQSPFLGNRERLLENDIGFVIYDVFPVSEGHSLIIPHRNLPFIPSQSSCVSSVGRTIQRVATLSI